MMNQTDLQKRLREHEQWLDGTGGARADLRWAKLRFAKLHGAKLREADLRLADLTSADLCGADLRGTGVVIIGLGQRHAVVSPTHVHVGCVRVPVDKLLARHAAGTVGELHQDAADWWSQASALVLAAIAATRTADAAEEE